jgi:hypothetical protein
MTQIEWETLGSAARILFPVVGTAIGSWVVKLLKDILYTMKQFNDRILALEHDQAAHEKLDNERFNNLRDLLGHRQELQ